MADGAPHEQHVPTAGHEPQQHGGVGMGRRGCSWNGAVTSFLEAGKVLDQMIAWKPALPVMPTLCKNAGKDEHALFKHMKCALGKQVTFASLLPRAAPHSNAAQPVYWGCGDSSLSKAKISHYFQGS